MRKSWLLLLGCLLGAGVSAQTSALPLGMDQEQDVAKIRELVQAGALPRNRLVEAEEALADTRDNDTLKRTLYGELSVEELTEEQSSEMVAAAKRRYERQVQVVQRAKELVDVGAKAPAAIDADLEELNFRRKTVDLAEARAHLLRELSSLAKLEADAASARSTPAAERYDGNGMFNEAMLKKVDEGYFKKFGSHLPISAQGMTEVHRSLGFDHSGRVDIALTPDQREGQWLRQYLEMQKIPYFAFREAIVGKATGAHIHIGPPSLRLRLAD